MADSSSTRPVALITGGSRGIGRAIALALADAGYDLVVNFASNQVEADATVAAAIKKGAKAIALQADVALREDRERLLKQTAQAFARLDVLVNNAAITSPGRPDLLELQENNWDRVLGTNLKAPFFLSQAAARAMIEHLSAGRITRGCIINISSISAYALSIDRADYCIAKSALRMLTQLFATRLADDGIRVFEVCPGVIETDMTAPVHAKYDARIKEGLSPQRRWGQPEDVAKAVVALVGDDFPFSTGNCIDIDGGFHIRRL